MDNAYDYRGYIITETPSGYFIVHGYDFFSYDEACDWIDDQLDDSRVSYEKVKVPELHLYHIFYVTRDYDRGFDEYVQAYSEDEAIKYLKRRNRDIAYIADVDEVN